MVVTKEFPGVWGICHRCGFKYRLHDLRKDGYKPSLLVCEQCYDPPVVDEASINYVDDFVVPNPSPEPNPQYDTVTIHSLVQAEMDRWEAQKTANS